MPTKSEPVEVPDEVLLKRIKRAREVAFLVKKKYADAPQAKCIWVLARAATVLTNAIERIHAPEGAGNLQPDRYKEAEAAAGYAVTLLFVLGKLDGFDPIDAIGDIASEVLEDFDICEHEEEEVSEECPQVGTGGRHSKDFYEGDECQFCGAKKPELPGLEKSGLL